MKLEDLFSILDENKGLIVRSDGDSSLIGFYNGKDSIDKKYNIYEVVDFSVGVRDCTVHVRPPKMREIYVTAYPFVRQYGKIEVPEAVEDIREYVEDHYDSIQFGDCDIDHDDATFDIFDEKGEIINED